jgi:Flp pilus assembly protein TadD
MATYERALESGVRDATLMFNLGVLCEDLGRPERARDAYVQALELDPDLADAHCNLALLHEAAGRERDAVRHFNAYRQLTRGRAR